MTKLYAQEKQVFDINKVTVVGSPTITSDGVASGFTTANYIASPTTLTINPNIFRICFEFTTGSDITTAQMIIRSMENQNAFIIGLKSGKMRLLLNAEDSPDSWDIAYDILSTKVLTANTKYSGYLGFNGFKYTLNLNNEDWITVESSVLMRSSFALKIGQGMYTEPFLGSVNLQAIRVYSNNELIYSPTRPKTFLEKRKLKKKWFTIIGNPTITANKLASGFSNKNYIETFNSSLLANPFELYFGFTATNVTNRQTIFGMQTGYGFNIGIEGGKMMFGASSIGASLDIASNLTSSLTINTNTKYLGRLKWTGTVYTLSLYINNAWVDYITVNNSNAILAGKTVNVGLINNTYPYINGTIDLKDIKLVVNSIPVFDGSLDTYEYDASKFTVVGSPMITEYGVASFPIADDYVDMQLSSNVSSTWKIKTKFTTGTALDAIRTIFHNYLPGVLNNRSEVFLNYNKLGASITVDNDNYIATTATGSINVITNTTYWVSLSFNGEKYTFEYSTDGITWKQIWNVSSTTNVLQQKLRIGNNANVDRRFNGSISLPSISITVDGKEVFTGAKEQYYAMKGGM